MASIRLHGKTTIASRPQRSVLAIGFMTQLYDLANFLYYGGS
jgi:hypothetical protein